MLIQPWCSPQDVAQSWLHWLKPLKQSLWNVSVILSMLKYECSLYYIYDWPINVISVLVKCINKKRNVRQRILRIYINCLGDGNRRKKYKPKPLCPLFIQSMSKHLFCNNKYKYISWILFLTLETTEKWWKMGKSGAKATHLCYSGTH